ncbi:hypothetical protein N1851_021892 [Merluccius polli]|uniref:ribonuclease H n=1 Tax=Merluccius polli TaxID=89951 RepID=A0AA47MJ50_MERPO|nr:hypothetical protein N1851_021892 [Merluccius polli]
MDVAGVPSPKINWESQNLPGEWKKFKQHVELMFSGPFRSKNQAEKCSYLLLWVGEKGRDIYNTWTLTADDARELKTYYERYEAYVLPKKNTIFSRYKFHEKVQGANETLEQFATELKLLVKDCAYANEDEMVRDRIVFGIQSAKVREKLLSVGSDLTLDKTMDIARSHELALLHTRSIGNGATSYAREQVVHAVHRQQQHTAREASRGARKPDKEGRDWKPAGTGKAYGKNCGYCGGRAHRDNEHCPARGKQCAKCGKLNHFAKVCKSTSRRSVHAVSHDENGETDELFIDAITKRGHMSDSEQAFADIKLGKQGTVTKFKLDTGAQVNVIPLSLYHQLHETRRLQLQPTTRMLTGYGGQQLAVKGMCKINSAYKERDMTLDFYIVDTKAPPVLGLNACLDLDLIKLVLSVTAEVDQKSILEKFSDVFQGIGLFPGECTIHLDPAATPVVCPPRRVPIALRSRLQKELQHMEDTRIIAKVTEPSEWVNSFVVVEKPRTGKLRVCLDPRDLNKAIKRPHYPLPTLEDITHKLAGAKYFSVLDARSGYWAIKLTTASSKLTTFNTPFGQYRFLRLPFGLISAQDEFQRKIDETYQGLEGVVAIVDDVLKYSFTITHRPGKDIPVADTLSRKSLAATDNSLSEGMDVQVHTVFSNMPVSHHRLSEIQKETERDEQLTVLRKIIQDGWPGSGQSCQAQTGSCSQKLLATGMDMQNDSRGNSIKRSTMIDFPDRYHRCTSDSPSGSRNRAAGGRQSLSSRSTHNGHTSFAPRRVRCIAETADTFGPPRRAGLKEVAQVTLSSKNKTFNNSKHQHHTYLESTHKRKHHTHLQNAHMKKHHTYLTHTLQKCQTHSHTAQNEDERSRHDLS